jgi:carboxypeptidase T
LKQGLPCKGVDINRNYDFLWNSGIGTSADSCDEIFKGAGAFSEPETKNVRYLLVQCTNINYMVDVHSYSEDILYPWGDDDNQTSDPLMNFMNPKYDGLRGYLEDTDQPNDPNDPGGADEPKENLYQEYIGSSDLD